MDINFEDEKSEEEAAEEAEEDRETQLGWSVAPQGGRKRASISARR